MAETNTGEQVVSTDALQASLDDLLKAAGTSKEEVLSKGSGSDSEMDGTSISTSGHEDERGKVGGGMAGKGDIGPQSSAPWETKMMIAKMMEAGYISPGPNFAGFAGSDYMKELAGKMEGDEGKEEEKELKEKELKAKADGGFIPDSRPTPTQKSHSDDFGQDPAIADAIDASDFMEAITTRTTESLDALGKSLAESETRQSGINTATAQAVFEVGTLIKSQQVVIHELGTRLGIVEKQPAPPKGATTLTAAQTLSKSLPNEAGPGGGGGKYDALNKSDIARTLSYMNLEKGISEIGGTRTADLVCKAEGGGIVSEATLEATKRFLTTHPNEAERALNYS
jgi:hypothetical protein